MKKTNFFLLFLIVSIPGVCLSNEIFASNGMGFYFRGVLLLIGLLMYAISVYHRTHDLMNTEIGLCRLVHLVRLGAVAMTVGTFFYCIKIADSDKIEEYGKEFYYFTLYTSISLIVMMLLLIFINDDIQRKKPHL